MIQDRRHNPHDVAEAMYQERQKKYEKRRCPREYCDLEFKGKEAHPEQ